MNATDQQKVLTAGFNIIRADDHPGFRIKIKTVFKLDWHTLEKDFKSAHARDKRMAELAQNPTTIID